MQRITRITTPTPEMEPEPPARPGAVLLHHFFQNKHEPNERVKRLGCDVVSRKRGRELGFHPGSGYGVGHKWIPSAVKMFKHLNPDLTAVTFSGVIDMTPTKISELMTQIPDINYFFTREPSTNPDEEPFTAGCIWVKVEKGYIGIRKEAVPKECPLLQLIKEENTDEGDPIITLPDNAPPANKEEWRMALWGDAKAFEIYKKDPKKRYPENPTYSDEPEEVELSAWTVVELLDYLGMPWRKPLFDKCLSDEVTGEFLESEALQSLGNVLSDETLPKTQKAFERKVAEELRNIYDLPNDLVEDETLGFQDRIHKFLCACPSARSVVKNGFNKDEISTWMGGVENGAGEDTAPRPTLSPAYARYHREKERYNSQIAARYLPSWWTRTRQT